MDNNSNNQNANNEQVVQNEVVTQPEVLPVEQVPTSPVEQVPATPVEQVPASPVEQVPATPVEQPQTAPVQTESSSASQQSNPAPNNGEQSQEEFDWESAQSWSDYYKGVKKNFFSGFNKNAGPTQQGFKKKRSKVRLALDLIILAAVVIFAIAIINPFEKKKDERYGESVDVTAKKEECQKKVLDNIKLKYEIEPEVLDLSLDKTSDKIEYCKLNLKYKKKDFTAAIYWKENNEILQDNYQYSEIVNYLTESITKLTGEDLYNLDLKIPNSSSTLETVCPNCLTDKVNTENLKTYLTESKMSLYFKNKDFDVDKVYKVLTNEFYASYKLTFNLYSYQAPSRSKKDIVNEPYKEYYLYKEIVIGVPSGMGKYDYLTSNKYDTYNVDGVYVVFFGKKRNGDSNFSYEIDSETKEKTCYKLTYDGYGKASNVNNQNFSLYTSTYKDILIQGTPVLLQNHDYVNIYYSLNRFVIYSDYDNIMIDMCVLKSVSNTSDIGEQPEEDEENESKVEEYDENDPNRYKDFEEEEE